MEERVKIWLNPLPNHNILDGDKIMISVLDPVKNIEGKGENAGYQHSLLFPQCFQKASFLGFFKLRIAR